MAQTNEESLLTKLLKTHYPHTFYLSRQLQFLKAYPSTSITANSVPQTESTANVIQKRKTPLPPPPCFNVPDTLDFNASAYERHEEVGQSSGTDEDNSEDFDETLLKNINNRINDKSSDKINQIKLARFELEFSPYEYNSPVQRAIENGLKIINKQM